MGESADLGVEGQKSWGIAFVDVRSVMSEPGSNGEKGVHGSGAIFGSEGSFNP